MSGVYLINKRTGKSVFYQQESDQNNETPDKYIRSIYKDDEGIIWTGGMYSLKAYEPEKRQKVVYDIGYSINQITRRDSVSLWIGSMYGIYVFDKTRKELRAFHSDIDLDVLIRFIPLKNLTEIQKHILEPMATVCLWSTIGRVRSLIIIPRTVACKRITFSAFCRTVMAD